MEPLSTVHASADDSCHLQSLLDLLSTRVNTFEHELHEAITAEHAFQHSLQTVSHALDAFVESHRQEDVQLSRLIAQDTQRSRETKEEYDALAARFDAAFRRTGSTRRRELLGTVWLYVGIVLSVVFMAPVHLIVSVVDGVVRRAGFDDGRVGKGEKSGGRRQKGRGGGGGVKSGGRVETAEWRVVDGRRRDRERGDRDEENGVAMQDLGRKADKQKNGESKVAGGGVGNKDEAGNGESWSDDDGDGDDVFVDAVGGEEEVAKERRAVERKKKKGRVQQSADSMSGRSMSGTREDERRPDWARPVDDEDEGETLEGFPSNEFWEFCDDDLRIDSLRKEETER